MSVPTYKRKESSTEFFKELLELNVRCGQIVMNKPKKYRANYGDSLIQQCLKALQSAQMANSIYISASTEEFLFNRRKELFHETIELCNSIPTTARIFLELTRSIEGEKEVCYNAEMFFAEKCSKISQLIKGVIESDAKRYKEYKNK